MIILLCLICIPLNFENNKKWFFEMIEIGDKAPAFKGKDQNGKEIKLADYKGKKLILFFYPEDDTPACTKEACNLRDNYSLLKKEGFELLGISPNDEASHQKFIKKFNLPFPLLADDKKKVINTYGVWGEKNLYGRKYMGLLRRTFVIDEKGKIERIIKGVRTADHANQILKSYK